MKNSIINNEVINSCLTFLSQDKVLIFESKRLIYSLFSHSFLVKDNTFYTLDNLVKKSFNISDLYKPKVFICENPNVDKSILIKRLRKDEIFATYIVDNAKLFEYVGKAQYSDIYRKKNEGGGHTYYNESNVCIAPFLDTSICDTTEIQLVLDYEKITTSSK